MDETDCSDHTAHEAEQSRLGHSKALGRHWPLAKSLGNRRRKRSIFQHAKTRRSEHKNRQSSACTLKAVRKYLLRPETCIAGPRRCSHQLITQRMDPVYQSISLRSSQNSDLLRIGSVSLAWAACSHAAEPQSRRCPRWNPGHRPLPRRALRPRPRAAIDSHRPAPQPPRRPLWSLSG